MLSTITTQHKQNVNGQLKLPIPIIRREGSQNLKLSCRWQDERIVSTFRNICHIQLISDDTTERKRTAETESEYCLCWGVVTVNKHGKIPNCMELKSVFCRRVMSDYYSVCVTHAYYTNNMMYGNVIACYCGVAREYCSHNMRCNNITSITGNDKDG